MAQNPAPKSELDVVPKRVITRGTVRWRNGCNYEGSHRVDSHVRLWIVGNSSVNTLAAIFEDEREVVISR